MDVAASARKHGIDRADMLHALRHHGQSFETDDPDVTLYVGPSRTGAMLEVVVVDNEVRCAIIHAMAARPKFLAGRSKR